MKRAERQKTVFSRVFTVSKKVAAMFFAVLLVLMCAGVPAPTVAFAEGEGGLAGKAPAHSKTISKNNDGTYDLTLSVVGDAESSEHGKPVDVVVAVDCSTSMNKSIAGRGDKSRLQAAHDAVESLAKSLLTDANAALPADQQIQMSVITFGRRVNVAEPWTTSADAAAKAVPTKAKFAQGTNWEAALNLANAQGSGRADAQKYIVFLSDGNPTHRGIDIVLGDGSFDLLGYNYDAAKAEANKRGTAGLYVVSAAADADKMQKFANETNGTFLDGTTADNLSKAFEQLEQIIKKSASYKDVRISDKISEYVTGTAADGTIDPATVRYQKGGADWAGAPTATIAGDTITWDLSSVGELEKDMSYSVTFRIKPSQAAFDATAAAGQDVEFMTNDEANSFVSYNTIVKETGKADVISAGQVGYKSPKIKVEYVPAPAKIDSITVQKEIKGRDWMASDEFQFEIEPLRGAPAPSNGESARATMNNKSASFGSFTFGSEGTYRYLVREVAGTAGGMTYDDHEAVITVEVEDNHKGQLEAKFEVEDGTFTNTYAVQPIEYDFTDNVKIAKTLSGRDLQEGEFLFHLYENGDLIARAQNKADGSVSFGAQEYDAPGTYTYTISEVGGDATGVTYDDATFQVNVVVKDNGDGTLSATANSDKAIVFNNVYNDPKDDSNKDDQKPGKPESGKDESGKDNKKPGKTTKTKKIVPATGDVTNMAAPVAFGVLAVACLAGGLALKARKK